MPLTIEAIFHEALSMPRNTRAELAKQLLDSLDQEDKDDLSTEWAVEIRRRLEAFRRGGMKTIPADEVLRSLPHGRKP